MKRLLATAGTVVLVGALAYTGVSVSAQSQEAVPEEVSVLAGETVALIMNALPRRTETPLRIAVEGLQTEDYETRLGELFAMAVTTRLVQRGDQRISVVALQHIEAIMHAHLFPEDVSPDQVRPDIENLDLLVNGKVYLAGETLFTVIQLLRMPDFVVVDGFERSLPASDIVRELLASGTTARPAGGDRFEPDSPERARRLEPGVVFPDHTLLPEGDEDWFLFEIEETASVTVFTFGDLDTYLEVYGPDDPSTLQAENDDAEDQNARVTFFTTGGRYWIKARGYSLSIAGPYSIGCEIETFAEEPTEPDNSLEQAGRLLLDAGWVERFILPVGDLDWFSLDVPASIEPGAMLTVETEGELDTYLDLFDDAGEQLIADDDSGDNQNARLEFMLERPGRYYIQARHFDDSRAGRYRIRATVIQMTPDRFEHDDSLDDASPIEIGAAAQEHTFVPGFDEDWVRFTLRDARTVTIETGGTTDTIVTLFDQGGNELGSDDDGSGVGSNARLQRYLPAGTYFVRITQYPGGAQDGAAYTVQVTGR